MAQEKWLVDGPKVIDVAGVRRLKVGLVGGSVDVVAHDEPDTRVEVHGVEGRDLRVALVGDTLEIDHPQLRWDNFIDVFRWFRSGDRADVSVMLPRSAVLKLGVISASALVSGLAADAQVSTVTGDVVVDGVTGDLQLNAVSGELTVRDHTGEIVAHTVGGDITASGAIRRFAADGVSGEVVLDVTGTPDEVKLNTVSGRLTTRLEPGVPARYKVNTVTGRIRIDDADVRNARGQVDEKHGDLDRTWLAFTANSVSGDVSVLHAVRA